MIDLGITTVYRGQRNGEDYKSPIRDGQSADGITYRFPLQDWTEAEVWRYLRQQGVEIPEHYGATRKSLDCWCCTGYLDAKLDQLHYLQAQHPEKYEIVHGKIREIRAAVHKGIEPLESACK
jgi:3'-phosphoadenosine 5'-phosphosulfate sulfotransferase (PAPS reductase)/FAD synthetase